MTMPDVLRDQATACTTLGSPFMGQLLTALADSWPSGSALDDFCGQFQGDIGASGASLPLRLAGALHALVLKGLDGDLTAAYPPNTTDSATLTTTVWQAIDRHTGFILDWMQSAPQTNEVRRSAVLIPAAHWLAARFGLPFKTSELGASAGLNLAWDRFGLETPAGRLGPDTPALTLTPDWQGAFPDPQTVTVEDTRGVDLNPLDPTDPQQQMRLFSYLWPDQPYRMDLTRAAITARLAAVDRDDAITWLDHRLQAPAHGQLHLIYHTIAWQYFPKDRQDHGTRLIEAAGARATDTTPLAWLRFEADGQRPGAGITLRLWPGDLTFTLGRADFHGRWVHWSPTQHS